VTIGLSLPLAYLAGADDGAAARCLSDAFGRPRDCLAYLRDNGITSIELQAFGPDTSPDTFLDAVERILGSGMHLTLHGHLADNTAGRPPGDVHSQFLSAADALGDRQEETVVVVHALARPGASYGTMLQETTRALARLVEDIRTHDLPVTIGLEITRYHGAESPGTHYDGLLEIAGCLRNARVGFCWDLGHTCSSVLQRKLPPAPPPEFIANVVHTHVHHLSPEGDTHWPLTDSCPHLASGISRLAACGYAGIYNLELYPTRWAPQQDAREGILRSVLCLRKILARIRCRQQPTSQDPVEPCIPGDDGTCRV
jgi:sugar phosphate isomerase/epimerase